MLVIFLQVWNVINVILQVSISFHCTLKPVSHNTLVVQPLNIQIHLEYTSKWKLKNRVTVTSATRFLVSVARATPSAACENGLKIGPVFMYISNILSIFKLFSKRYGQVWHFFLLLEISHCCLVFNFSFHILFH